MGIEFTHPVSAFIVAAFVPRDAHRSGTLDEAEAIRARYPEVARANILTAALLADEAGVRSFVARDPSAATMKGGTYDCDALTHLCFSRYLRLDRSRSDAFVATARVLLDAGASANTGWWETIDKERQPRQVIEAAIYGAAGIAQHAALTRLLLERGADPNDEETPYHVPETRDNTVLQILIDSGRLNEKSLRTVLVRKTDWHDLDGLRLALDAGVDPNLRTVWGTNALEHAIQRDNDLDAIVELLNRGADPLLPRDNDGRTPAALAAQRGRADVLRELRQRGVALEFTGITALVAACALDEETRVQQLVAATPSLTTMIAAHGGTLLAEFAGVGNTPGVRHLIALGVPVSALYGGDGYFDIPRQSTALHVAAWRARHNVVKELIARGADVDAIDGRGRTPLQLAVKACVDSYWMGSRKPDSVKALLDAGASKAGIEVPSGYDEIDRLLRE